MSEPSELHWEIVIVEGGGKDTRYPLRANHVALGRQDPGQVASEELILLPDPTVSRVHAVLDWEFRKARYLLTHKSSTNATVVNGAQVIKPQYIQAGDRVKMGRLVMEIRVAVPEPTAAVARPAEAVTEAISPVLLARSSQEPVAVSASIKAPEPPPPSPVAPPEDFEQLVANLQEPAPVKAPLQEPVAPTPPPLERARDTVLMEPTPPAQIPERLPLPLPLEASAPPEEEPAAAEPVEVRDAGVEQAVLASLPERLELPIEQAQDEEEPPVVVEAAAPAVVEAAPAVMAEGPSVEAPVSSEAESLRGLEPEARPFLKKARKVGRNEFCPCGSGKKYKKCCGRSSYG